MNDIEALVNSYMPLLTKLLQRYKVWENPESEDIQADCRAKLVELAQTHDISKGKFTTQCFFKIRNEIFTAVAKCQSIRQGSDIVTTNNMLKKRQERIDNRLCRPNTRYDMLTIPVYLDEPKKSKKFTDYNVADYVLPSIMPPSYNDIPTHLIKKALTSLEYNLVILYVMSVKQKQEYGGINKWQADISSLVIRYVGLNRKMRGKMAPQTIKKYCEPIIAKVKKYYEDLGYVAE